MIKGKLLYEEETYKILGACFTVYKEMGSGFLEAVYQECLEHEFRKCSIPFNAQPELPIKYGEIELEKTYKPDFICSDKIIVEIKATSSLTDEHRAQLFNYLKASETELGLLVNFGHYPKLEHERYVLSQAKSFRNNGSE